MVFVLLLGILFSSNKSAVLMEGAACSSGAQRGETELVPCACAVAEPRFVATEPVLSLVAFQSTILTQSTICLLAIHFIIVVTTVSHSTGFDNPAIQP